MTWETLLFAAVFASLLMTFAFADLVQPGPVEVLTFLRSPAAHYRRGGDRAGADH